MLITLLSVVVAAFVGVPVVTRLVQRSTEESKRDDPQHKSSPQELSLGEGEPHDGMFHEAREGGEPSPSTSVRVSPETHSEAPDEDPFSSLDLQELALLTNSPALNALMGAIGTGTPSTPPQAAPPPQASTPARAQKNKEPAVKRATPHVQPIQSASPSPQGSAPNPSKRRSLVSVQWNDGDHVESTRETPSADALFSDVDAPKIERPSPSTHRQAAPPPPKPQSEPHAKRGPRRQAVREVGASRGAQPATGPAPTRAPTHAPLTLNIDKQPSAISPQPSFEVMTPTTQPTQPKARSGELSRASERDELGSARPSYLDFKPFFALDALRFMSEFEAWARPRPPQGGEGEEQATSSPQLAHNEGLPEWCALLAHVNGFLFDLAQEQLKTRAHLQLVESDLEHELSWELAHNNPLTRPAVSFRPSQWADVPTEEFIVPRSAPKTSAQEPRLHSFSREG